jgi:RimJ/RimL family protein N-acetyltransferase
LGTTGGARQDDAMDRPDPVIVADPVVLRRWRDTPEDARVVDRLVAEALDHLLPWMPWAASHDAGQAAAYVGLCEVEWDTGLAYNYAITVDGAPAGSCGLMRRIGRGGLEIGYWVHPSFTRRGVATAAAGALVLQAFRLPGVGHVEIHHDAANTASGAVARRLGFTEVARCARGITAPGEVGVEVTWRLTR